MRVPKHPFPVRTVFRHCALVNFRVEPDALASLLPRPLTPAIAHDRGWLSVVIAQMEHMRPSFVPKLLGITYNQIVYRAVVDCEGHRGVHFVRSDANNRVMTAFGNLMSFFRFHYGTVDISETSSVLSVDAHSHETRPVVVRANYDLRARQTELGAGSAFSDLREAKTFLVDLFDAYHPPIGGHPVDVVSIDRSDWQVHVVPNTGEYSFMEAGTTFRSDSATLDSVFVVDDLHYRWHRLKKLQ